PPRRRSGRATQSQPPSGLHRSPSSTSAWFEHAGTTTQRRRPPPNPERRSARRPETASMRTAEKRRFALGWGWSRGSVLCELIAVVDQFINLTRLVKHLVSAEF